MHKYCARACEKIPKHNEPEVLEGSIFMKLHQSAAVCTKSINVSILRHALRVGLTKYNKLKHEMVQGLEMGRLRVVAQNARTPAPVHAKRNRIMRNQRLAEGGGGA